MLSVLNERLAATWTSPFVFASHRSSGEPTSEPGPAELRTEGEEDAVKRRKADERPPTTAVGHVRRELEGRTAKSVSRSNPWGFSGANLEKFPQARQRNFFVIHNHHATAKHFDLRLQCAGSHDHEGRPMCERCGVTHSLGEPGTISWAIPKGLSDWSPGIRRLAVETTLHPIDYSFFESEFEGQFGTTMLWDVGTYEVVTSARSRKQGVDRDPDTDDEAQASQGIGWQHEKALREAYRTRFSFTLILRGARHTSRISFVSPQDPNQVGFAKSGVTRNITARRRWFVIQSPTDDGRYINLEKTERIQGRSILTGRTMDEIQADMEANGRRLNAELRGASSSRGMLQILKEKHDRMQHGEHHIALKNVFEEADEEEDLPAMQRAYAKRAKVEVTKALRLPRKKTGK